MRHDMKYGAITTAALAGAFFTAQPAMAESVEVPYEDLDLTTAKDRETLDQRIDKAARQVCGANEATVGSRIRSQEVRACIKQAKQQIEASLAKMGGVKKAGG